MPAVSGPNNTLSVAAGGKDYLSSSHWVGVAVVLSPPLAGQKIRPLNPFIVGPTHVNQAWRGFLLSEEYGGNQTSTSGPIDLGGILTSDRANANFEVSIPGQPSEVGPAHYRQAWDESTGDYSYSQDSHWSYNKDFDYDTDIDVTFRPKFRDSYYPGGDAPSQTTIVPIIGHTMNFMVGKMQVSGIIDRGYSYARTWIFTSDPLEVLYSQYGSYSGPPVKLVSQAVLDDYVVCTPRQFTNTSQAGVNAGVYKTKLRVKEPPSTSLEEHMMHIGDMIIYDAKIDQVWMKAQDNDVYQPDPPTP